MNNIIFIFCILFIRSSVALSCCAETEYRLLPIGELNKKLIFIEFDFNRNCRMRNTENKEFNFFVRGTVNLVNYENDSLVFLENIDTLSIEECSCSYDNYLSRTSYEKHFEKAYLKGLNSAKKNKNFILAETGRIIFNDTINTQIRIDKSDSMRFYVISDKSEFQIDLSSEQIISCYPDKTAEVREYESLSYLISVYRLRCQPIKESEVLRNRNRFKNIETAFWKEQVQWHGISKDYYRIRKK